MERPVPKNADVAAFFYEMHSSGLPAVRGREDVCMQSVGPSLRPIMAVLMLEDKKQPE